MFGPTSHLSAFGPAFDQSKQMDKLDPMQNQLCRVCDEPAAGFHFGAFTCEGCKSFFGRTSNNQSVIQDCKNNYRCIINKKNRTACKACRLRKCLMVGMSKSGSRYGRRSNWFKIHCLMQQAVAHRQHGSHSNNPFDGPPVSEVNTHPMMSHPMVSNSMPSLMNMKTTEVRPTKPTSLWRPLDPTDSAGDRDPPKGLFLPPSKSIVPPTTSPQIQVKSVTNPPSPPPYSISSSSSPGVFPDLSHLFRLQGSPNLSNGNEKEEVNDLTHVSPLAAAAAAAANASRFYSAALGTSPLAFLPPTFNIPALSALPLHKQMLLSPLLASSHLWASARKAYPFFPPAGSPSTDSDNVLAEHKALLERFRNTLAQASPSFDPKSPIRTVDLEANSDDDSSSLTSEAMPHLSDTDEEEDETSSAQQQQQQVEKEKIPKRKDEMPLDLTCA